MVPGNFDRMLMLKVNDAWFMEFCICTYIDNTMIRDIAYKYLVINMVSKHSISVMYIRHMKTTYTDMTYIYR